MICFDGISSQSLTKKFKAESLQGFKIKLEPYSAERDLKILFDRTNGSPFTLLDRSIENYDCDDLIWKYLPVGPFSTEEGLNNVIIKNTETQNYNYFTVFDLPSQSQIGLIALINNFPEYQRTEIGSVIFCPLAQRTGANTEANYLLLSYCFSIGYRRIEWKCNNLNERSKQAALSIGFMFEMVQECHMIVKGCQRDTAWFAILLSEWLDVKYLLETKMSRYGWGNN